MLRRAKQASRKLIASVMLFTAETLMALVLFSIAFTIFLLIARHVFVHHGDAFDTAAFNWLGSHVTRFNTRVMLVFTTLGNHQFLIPANLILICVLLFRKHKWYSIKVASVALSSVILMFILKEWFKRKRPPVPLLDPAIGLSFPSGHAMSSVTFYGLLIWFIWQQRAWNIYFRVAAIAILLFIILGIGASRIYLRVHYATDVIGGYAAGLIWLILSIWLISKLERFTRKKIAPVVDAV